MSLSERERAEADRLIAQIFSKAGAVSKPAGTKKKAEAMKPPAAVPDAASQARWKKFHADAPAAAEPEAASHTPKLDLIAARGSASRKNKKR